MNCFYRVPRDPVGLLYRASFLLQKCDKDAENIFDAAQDTSNGVYLSAVICMYFIISGIVGHFAYCCKAICGA